MISIFERYFKEMKIEVESIINLVFCLLIAAIGLWGFFIIGNYITIYIAVSFIFFALTHIAVLLKIEEKLWFLFLSLRIIGYVLTVHVLFMMTIF